MARACGVGINLDVFDAFGRKRGEAGGIPVQDVRKKPEQGGKTSSGPPVWHRKRHGIGGRRY